MTLTRIAVAACLALGGANVSAHAAVPCRQTPAVTAGKQIVDAAPEVLDTRLNLAELMVDAGCYEDAWQALQAGAQFHPGNERLRARLRLVRGLLDESRLEQPFDESRVQTQALHARDVVRCTRVADVAACRRALANGPADATLNAAAGDAFARARLPEEAMAAYQQAAAQAAGNTALGERIRARKAAVGQDARKNVELPPAGVAAPAVSPTAVSPIAVAPPRPVVTERRVSGSARDERTKPIAATVVQVSRAAPPARYSNIEPKTRSN